MNNVTLFPDLVSQQEIEAPKPKPNTNAGVVLRVLSASFAAGLVVALAVNWLLVG